MNRSLKKVLLGTGFAALSLVTLSSASWSKNHGMGMGHDPARMLAHMAEKLELTDEQREEVASLLNSAEQATASDRQRLKELRGELQQQGPDFDAGRVQSLADEVGQITSRLVYQAASTQSQLQALLSVEQREELAGLMAKRGERRGKWHRGSGQPFND
jgi:protein CpxP